LLSAAAGSVFLWLNILQISQTPQDIIFEGGTVKIIQAPEPDNGADTADVVDSSLMSPEQSVDVAGLPAKLSPAPKTVSAPLVGEMPLTQDRITGDGALTRAGVISLTNKERRNYLGAGFALAENDRLNLAAAAKVKDMFDGQYFEHMSPAGNGADYFIESSGYEFILIGENLALGDYASDADLVKAWMDSQGHRENILKPGFREIGVAVGFGIYKGRQSWLAVQEFAVPKSACPQIDSDLSAGIDADKKTLDQFSSRENSLLAEISRQKAVARTLEKELNDLIAVNGSYAAIKAKRAELNAVVAAVNKDIGEYNSVIREMESVYNAYKSQIIRYNQQVNAYNACAAALE